MHFKPLRFAGSIFMLCIRRISVFMILTQISVWAHWRMSDTVSPLQVFVQVTHISTCISAYSVIFNREYLIEKS